MERDSVYWGVTPDSETVIKELERMRQEQGTNFIDFGWPSFWCFYHYDGNHSYLRKRYICVFENDRVIILSCNIP